MIAYDNIGGDTDFALAMRADELARLGVKMDSDPLLAGRAGVGDVHGYFLGGGLVKRLNQEKTNGKSANATARRSLLKKLKCKLKNAK